jgi:isopenicillin-N N-acyltransferase-like protein
MKRRDFLFGSASAAGAICLPFNWGCQKNNEIPEPDLQTHFNYLEVSGTNYDIGKQIGTRFSKEIMGGHLALHDLLTAVKGIVNSAPDVFYDPFLEAAQNYFPDYVDELQGIADGSGIAFADILQGNIFMEVVYLYYELSGKKKYSFPPDYGCSTIAYSKSGKTYLAHNEDLFTSFLSCMYLLKIKVNGKPEILTLSYPGILAGIPPGMNEAGIVQCGNDICGLHIEQSVPLIFQFRSVLDASSLDDAVKRAKFPHRARTMTHNIGSLSENKIISVEAAPSKNQSYNVDGFYVHTNHFVLDNMQDIELDPDGLPSSDSRFNKLTELSNAYKDKPNDVNGNLITAFMSSHDAEIPPCVHDHSGASTLSHSVFDFQEKNWKLYYSNPCLGNSKLFSVY